MKRIITAISIAALAVPAFAFAAEVSAPYEKTQFDRTLPDVQTAVSERASAGSTKAPGGNWANGAWAHDHNFIAPGR